MRAAGFDFGTSNSAIGIVKGNAAALAPIEGASTMVPTAVFFDFADMQRTNADGYFPYTPALPLLYGLYHLPV